MTSSNDMSINIPWRIA